MTKTYTIVLADDHALLRQGLARIIQGVDDLEVIGQAGDGLALLSLLEMQMPQLVILDISMPNLRGLEAIREIKARNPETTILILTMHKEYVHQAFAAGADGYLLKEDADSDLFSAIAAIRQGKRYLSLRLRTGLVWAHIADPLTLREKEVLKLIAEGKTNKEIAELLAISVRTVESHRASLLAKLRIKGMADLVKYALEQGFA
ncbi:MAG TPA: response regulator transcription factor [bacterium]